MTDQLGNKFLHYYNNSYIDSTKVGAGSNFHVGKVNIRAQRSQWFRHPNWTGDYKKDFIWDIALIKLNKKFPIIIEGQRYIINPVCLPTRDRLNLYDQELATLFAYGYVYDEKAWLIKSKMPDFLRKADFYVQPSINCWNGRMICSRRYNKSQPVSCDVSTKDAPKRLTFLPPKGDSGGGLVQYTDHSRNKAVLFGIVSGSGSPPGSEGCHQDVFTMFVPVAIHIDWIIETIKNN